jgi:hypothetical protein
MSCDHRHVVVKCGVIDDPFRAALLLLAEYGIPKTWRAHQALRHRSG